MTMRQAAAALEWSDSKFIRIEHGTTTVSATDVQAMLQLYGITQQKEIKRLTGIAAATWLNTGVLRKRMPFGKLMAQVSELYGPDGCPVTPEELSGRWEEPVHRIADAIEAVRILRETLTGQPVIVQP